MGQEENTELREKLEELEEDITDQQAGDLGKILGRSCEDLAKIMARCIAVNNSFRRGRRPPMKSCSCSTSSWSGSKADWRR